MGGTLDESQKMMKYSNHTGLLKNMWGVREVPLASKINCMELSQSTYHFGIARIYRILKVTITRVKEDKIKNLTIAE